MKTQIKNIALGAALIGGALSVNAQTTRSGFFVDDYTYRYEMNPAIGNSKNFISMPALGNVNVEMNGTVGLNDILYNVDGKTTTFLNPKVSVEELMKNLNDNNRIGADVKLTLLAAGFKAFGGYNTVTLNARTSMGVEMPREIFSLLKEGISNRTYDISDLRGFANLYGEIALGHSHQLGKDWRVGGTVKFLLGGANIDAKLNQATLSLGEDKWTINADAALNASIKGLQYIHDVNADTGHEYVSDIDVSDTGLNGFGMAFDLGVVYTPSALQNWSFSLALLDLGFMSWNNNMLASTNGLKTFDTDKYTFNVDEEATNSFENEWDKIQNDLSSLYELEDMGDQGGTTTGLGATLNTGVQFTLPSYKPLSFGLLNTTRIQGEYSWPDIRLSADIAPVKCLDGGINMSMGTFGVGFGWIVNFHTTGFNMFVGMDKTFGKLAKQGIPLSSNGSVNLGINFPF